MPNLRISGSTQQGGRQSVCRCWERQEAPSLIGAAEDELQRNNHLVPLVAVGRRLPRLAVQAVGVRRRERLQQLNFLLAA